jgi:hypothetical protein
MSITNDYVRKYLKDNPLLTVKEIADNLNLTYDKVRGIKARLANSETVQTVETPEGHKGVLTKGKMWQLHDGSWRESLTFEVDKVEEWNNFKEAFLKDLEVLGKTAKQPINPYKKEGEICLEISLPDVHIGKGDVYESIKEYITSIISLVSKAEKFGIDRILLPLGNDGMNSEGKRRTTTAGTPQEDTVHWQNSFRAYTVMTCKAIEELSQSYPVDVIIVTGNHDEERMFYAGEMLAAYFRNSDRVTVDNSGEYRKYYEYGTNMLLFTHGDKEKHSDLPLIMATEQPEMFARTKFREVHCGHLHKEKMDEYRGIKVRFLPSICVTDEWHKMKGYQNLRAAQAYLWNKKTGYEGHFQVSVV